MSSDLLVGVSLLLLGGLGALGRQSLHDRPIAFNLRMAQA